VSNPFPICRPFPHRDGATLTDAPKVVTRFRLLLSRLVGDDHRPSFFELPLVCTPCWTKAWGAEKGRVVTWAVTAAYGLPPRALALIPACPGPVWETVWKGGAAAGDRWVPTVVVIDPHFRPRPLTLRQERVVWAFARKYLRVRRHGTAADVVTVPGQSRAKLRGRVINL
jgi:hypothetical protein